MRKTIVILALVCGVLGAGSGWAADKLANAFATPAKEAQVWCYWWWLSHSVMDDIPPENFTAMLDAGLEFGKS